LTLLDTSVTFKILRLTDGSREWLQKNSRTPWDFGENLEFPEEEYLQYRDKTTKKFIPKDNKEFKHYLEKNLGGGNQNNNLKEYLD